MGTNSEAELMVDTMMGFAEMEPPKGIPMGNRIRLHRYWGTPNKAAR